METLCVSRLSVEVATKVDYFLGRSLRGSIGWRNFLQCLSAEQLLFVLLAIRNILSSLSAMTPSHTAPYLPRPHPPHNPRDCGALCTVPSISMSTESTALAHGQESKGDWGGRRRERERETETETERKREG